MELEQIIQALMGRINGPQVPTYAPGAQNGVPPLGGDEMFVGGPYPGEALPQMGATPTAPQMGSAGFNPDIVGALTGQPPQVPSPLRQRQASNMRNIGADGIPPGSEILRALRAQPQLMEGSAEQFFSGIGFPTGEADALAQIDAMSPEDRSAFYDYIQSDFTGDMSYSEQSPIQSILDGYRNTAPSAMQQFQDMTFEDRERFLNGLNAGLSPDEAMAPDGFDPREMLQDMSGYDTSGPERLYTAQAGDFTDERLAEEGPPPTADELAQMGESVGIDTEALRGLDLNATEARNFGYLLRMMEAENTIRELQDSNTLGQRLLEMLPGQDLESFFMDPDYRRYLLARENYNEAALRAATGATINDQEMPMQRRNYFPLPNDDQETRDLLQRQRQALMMAIMAASGPGGQLVPEFGQPVVPRETQGVATMRFNPATGQLEPIQ